MTKFKIAILGPIGQRVDDEFINIETFDCMVKHSEEIIDKMIKSGKIEKWEDVELYTTGAAFSEHIAVALTKIHNCNIFFCMPCPFDINSCKYINTDNLDKPLDRILNTIHNNFKRRTGIDSLNEISELMSSQNCRSFYFKEFANIHKLIHRCNFFVLFNFGNVPINKSYPHDIYKRFKFEKVCVVLDK